MDVGSRQGRPRRRTQAVTGAAAIENQRRLWRERQRRWRATHSAQNEVAGRGTEDGLPLANGILRWSTRRHCSFVRRSSQRIVDSLIRLLEEIKNPIVRAAVLDKVFTNQRVRPLLPDYYPSPEEARAQQNILKNIRADLQALKVPHSSRMFARKYAILEAVVSELDSDISTFHNILGTRKENLVAAVEHLRSATTVTCSQYRTPTWKKREGGVSKEVKVVVLQWWMEEMRVTPRRRDVRRKRLGHNLYDTHAAHLLLENQVCPSLHSSETSVCIGRWPLFESAHILWAPFLGSKYCLFDF